jgi:hypothetical protein
LQSATLLVEHIKLVSFLHLCAEQILHLLIATYFFSTCWHLNDFTFFMSPLCRQSAGSYTGDLLYGGGVGAVCVKVSDSHLSHFLSCGSVIFSTQSSVMSLEA